MRLFRLTVATTAAYRESSEGGLMTVNEGRGALGWEPVEGGDVFAIDNNNVVYGFWHELEQMRASVR